MDLHLGNAAATDSERAAVDSVLGPPPSGWRGGTRSPLDGRVAYGGIARTVATRSDLLPCLHALQDEVGWVSPAALDYVCGRLDIAPAEAYGVLTAYALFSTEKGPQVVAHVCDDIACRIAGGGPPEIPETNSKVEWRPTSCLGQCEKGSAAFVQVAGASPIRSQIAPFGAAERGLVETIGEGLRVEASPPQTIAPQTKEDRSGLRILRRVGVVDPESFDSYRASGGYEVLQSVLNTGPDAVLAELEASRLSGRGGAAFPTATKWRGVACAMTRPRYVVVNADESEPGTFKDRVLLENDPFALVEAMTVAGITVGAEKGFAYIRGEYPLAERRLQDAVRAARVRGMLGEDILGSGLSFDIEVRRGAGAYIAGEETALLNSIEGRRPEPRNKPPFPTDQGLFARPTLVNNVETLFNVLEVLRLGSEEYASVGTTASTGTRLFCLSGAVERPGVYEVDLGTTLGSLIDLAGGMQAGKTLKAVLLGGAAGTFVEPGSLDLALSLEATRAQGATLGSGAVMVLDESADIQGILRRMAQFFRDESCGQCVPCRVGTVRQEELLARVARGGTNSAESQAKLLADLGAVMTDASICGLGQTANSAIASAVRLGLVPGLREQR